MREQSERMEITSTDLLASVKVSFEIATSALVQAKTNLGILGFERTKNEVASVVQDLRNAIKQLEANAGGQRPPASGGTSESPCSARRCCMESINKAEPCWGDVEVSDCGFDEDRDTYPIYTCEGHRGKSYKPNDKPTGSPGAAVIGKEGAG